MSNRVDSRRQSQNDIWATVSLGQGENTVEFVEIVDDNLVDSDLHRKLNLFLGLVVPVQMTAIGPDSSSQSRPELSFACSINKAPLLGGNRENGEGRIGLAGKTDLGSRIGRFSRRSMLSDAGAKVRFVDDVEWGPVGSGKFLG